MNENFDFEIFPLGETAIVVELGRRINEVTHRKVQALSSHIENNPFADMVEIVPAYTTVTIFYDPMKLCDPLTGEHWQQGNSCIRSPYEIISSMIQRVVTNMDLTVDRPPRVIHIPVCYGGKLGPDLDAVAAHNGLTSDEVIKIHSAQDYLVYIVGFAPGFPYLGGMFERIATPRRSSPRLTIEAGTVGIGGIQTGIYPISTPGGWQLIGRTPIRLFRPEKRSPSLLKVGDIVRFQPINFKQ